MDFEIQSTSLVVGQEELDKLDTSNLRRIFFDIEGGLTYDSDILQVGWLETDWEFNILDVGSKYYRNLHKIDKDAYKVHNLSEEFLWSVSDTYFSTDLPHLPFSHDKPTMYITYTLFDIQKVRAEATKVGYDLTFGDAVSSLYVKPTPVSHFDAFMLSGKRLVDSVSVQGFTNVEKMVEELKGKLDVSNLQPHDALYDTLLLYELCTEWVR